jgi:hypothetical protein
MKSNVSTYIVPAIVIALFILTRVFNVEILFFKEGILGLWIVLTLYFSFIKIPDLNEKRIYLTTQNDSAFKHGNLILGSFMIIGVVLFYYFTKEVKLLLILLIIQSALLIFIHFYKKTETKGLSIYIKDQQLHYSIGKDSKEISLKEIEEVSIQTNRIIISREEKKKNYISFLELSQDEIKQAVSFFKSILNPKAVNIEH